MIFARPHGMTQEEKEKLLLSDLCARLPYGVKVSHFGETKQIVKYHGEGMFELNDGIITQHTNLKPYLRSLSTMTEEEIRQFVNLAGSPMHRFYAKERYFWYNVWEEEAWFQEKHFDYRGDLIMHEMALEAPEGMYKTEQPRNG